MINSLLLLFVACQGIESNNQKRDNEQSDILKSSSKRKEDVIQDESKIENKKDEQKARNKKDVENKEIIKEEDNKSKEKSESIKPDENKEREEIEEAVITSLKQAMVDGDNKKLTDFLEENTNKGSDEQLIELIKQSILSNDTNSFLALIDRISPQAFNDNISDIIPITKEEKESFVKAFKWNKSESSFLPYVAIDKSDTELMQAILNSEAWKSIIEEYLSEDENIKSFLSALLGTMDSRFEKLLQDTLESKKEKVEKQAEILLEESIKESKNLFIKKLAAYIDISKKIKSFVDNKDVKSLETLLSAFSFNFQESDGMYLPKYVIDSGDIDIIRAFFSFFPYMKEEDFLTYTLKKHQNNEGNEIAKLLISTGAKITEEAIEEANKNGNEEMVSYMKEISK